MNTLFAILKLLLHWLNPATWLLPRNTVARYIASNIWRFFGLVLFVLLSLFFMFDLLAELEDLGKGSYNLRKAVIFTLLQVPGHMYDAMPIATVAGTIVALAMLASGSEITVLRAAGMAPRQLMWHVLKVGIPLVMLTIALGEYVAPKADEAANKIRLAALNLGINGELKSGTWLRDKLPDGGIAYLNAKSLSLEGDLQNIKLYEFDAQSRLRKVVLAKTAKFDTNAWIMREVLLQTHELETGKIIAKQTLAEWRWETAVTPAAMAGLQKLPERQSLWTLSQNVFFLAKNGLDYRKSLSVLLRRLIHPVGVLVMLALAMPFAYVRARSGGVAARVFAGVLMGIAFHVGNNLFQFLGLVQGWPVWLSAQMPIWIGLGIAILLFWRFHRLS